MSESTCVSVSEKIYLEHSRKCKFLFLPKKNTPIFRVKITPESWYSSLNQIGIGHLTSDQWQVCRGEPQVCHFGTFCHMMCHLTSQVPVRKTNCVLLIHHSGYSFHPNTTISLVQDCGRAGNSKTCLSSTFQSNLFFTVPAGCWYWCQKGVCPQTSHHLPERMCWGPDKRIHGMSKSVLSPW